MLIPECFSAALASGSVIFASNILSATGYETSEWTKRGVAIGIMSSVTLMHTFFPKAGVHGMNFFAMLQVSLLIFIVVTGWVLIGIRGPVSDFSQAFEGSVVVPNPYATALFKVLDAFDG